MSKKKSIKIDKNEELVHNIDDDIVLEEDISGVSDKIKKLQKKLKECEKDKQEYLNGWQRDRASAVNRDKEVALEREVAISRAQENVFIELFPILDSFDIAFSNKEVWESVDKNWRSGIEQIYTQAIRIFEQANISIIDEVGIFDPNIHEPVKTEDVGRKEDDNKVLVIIQKGYRKQNRVLRPAKVIIGKFK